MKKLVFVTNNKNKLAEIQSILGPSKYDILSLSDINCSDEIEEPFSTLEENALAKSSHIQKKYSLDCFADDTGLEVDALFGKPGVYSARYAGEPSNSEKNINKLLTELKGSSNRQARFRTVISLILNDDTYLFEGIVEGIISDEVRGKDGFGYDPVFIPNDSNLTFAEMSLSEKNMVSHRAKAVFKLVEFLNSREF